MKTLLHIIIVCYFGCIGCATSNRTQYPITKCVSGLVDITDSLFEVEHLHTRQVAPLLPVLQKGEHLFEGALFRIGLITDTRMTETKVVSIPWEDNYETTEGIRTEVVDTFAAQLTKAIEYFKTLPLGLPKSTVFEKLAMELTTLSECSVCTERTLIVLSDLRQNNPIFNAYDSVEFAHFTTCQTCFDSLLTLYSFPISLKGITIYFIHQSLNMSDDEGFFLIASTLKRNFVGRGAKVIISSTLDL